MATSYSTGTVTLANGATSGTISGGALLTNGVAGGDIFEANGLTMEIATVPTETTFTIVRGWPGTSLSGNNYSIRFTPQSTRILTKVNALLAQLANGVLSGLSAISSPAADKLAYLTGAATWAAIDFKSWARAFLSAADAPAGRTALGLGTIATQASTAVNIDGGAIDGTAIGASAASTARFTAITVSVDNPVITLNKANGGGAQFLGQVGGVARWGMLLGNGASESGSNVGSDFTVYRSNDAGTYMDTPFKIVRSTGTIEMLSVDINSGAIDGAVVGGSSAAAGTFTTLRANNHIKTAAYTVGTVPSASTAGAGGMIHVSNEAGGAVLAFSDGTNWRRVTDRAIIS